MHRSTEVFRHRARVAALSRSRPASDPEFVQARSALAAALLERDINETLAAGLLTLDQRNHLASLLASGRAW